MYLLLWSGFNPGKELRSLKLCSEAKRITEGTKHKNEPDKFSCLRSSSVQWFSRVRLFVTPWTTALQASLSITNSQILPKLMSIASVMPSSNCFIPCHSLLLLPSIFPTIRVFSNELALHSWWPRYQSFSISISLSNEYFTLPDLNGSLVFLT